MYAAIPAAATPTAIGDLVRDALGDDPDPDFDAITAAAARMLGTKLSLVSFAHGDRLWFKSASTGPQPEIALDGTFCREVVTGGEAVAIPDLAADARFADSDLVTGADGARFYAGVPIVAMGVPVGSLCVIDDRPRPALDGEIRVLRGLAHVVRSLMEARIAAVDARRDTDALQAALLLAQRLHRQFEQAERMAQIGSWRLNLADSALEWSDQVYRIHELPTGQGPALTDALTYYPGTERTRIEGAVARAMATGAPYDLELDFVTARGTERRVRAIGEVEMQGGAPVALIGVFQDVTERHRLQQALEQAANTDELTRIAGRRAFNRHFDEAIVAAQATGSTLAVALIDLDHFKQLNDRLGHAAGDDVLRRAAAALHAPWLRGSFAARLGGDEFVLMIADPDLLADLEGAMRRLLASLVLSSGGSADVTVSATIGICRIAPGSVRREAALRCADAALYRAKAAARGTCAFADEA